MIIRNQRNPVLPLSIHIPDSEAHTMPDGKLYLYGSFDDSSDHYCSGKYHVVSTADLKAWTIEDLPSLTEKSIPWIQDPNAPKYPGIDWSNPSPFMLKALEDAPETQDQAALSEIPRLLYAPDCIFRDGQYYLYFCTSDESEGVAVSDRPTGPFCNPVQLPAGGIDPAVFIDDDGQAYYYWGQISSHGAKLNEDMCSLCEDSICHGLVTEAEHFFHEGSSIRKIGDTYYYIFADMERGRPTALGYATGKSPLGPFTYRGIIIDNARCDPESWNNHGSIECFGGQWYVFYHRSSRGSRLYRRLCIEKIHILPDGSIPEVKMTSQGLGDPFGPGEEIMGYQACEVQGGCRIDADTAYGEVLTNCLSGASALFRYVRNQKPWHTLQITAQGKGRVEILLNGEFAGMIQIHSCEQYRCYTAEINCMPGDAELCLRFSEAEDLKIAKLMLDIKQ